MKIFEIINNQPSVTTEGLLIPEFNAIWKADKSKDKKEAFGKLCYIYFIADYKSLYLAYPEELRSDMVAKDYLNLDKYKPTKDVADGIRKYRELQNTPTMRFLQDNISAMESMGKYFRDIDWDQEDMNGKPKYDITKVSNAVKQAGGIIDNIEKLKEKVQKEQTIGSKARGGTTGGLLEND